MTATRAFFDTNVLLYLASEDSGKARVADGLAAKGGVVSIQVLDEFASVASRKFRLAWPVVRELLEAVRLNMLIAPSSLDTHELGLDIAERYGFSIYDSMLLAAALLADCTTFWSEDLHDGQVIEDTLTIRNPFA